MVMVSRKEINKAKMTYRQHHHLLKEFDYGYTHFEEFIGLNQHQRLEYHFGTAASTHIEVTELSKAKMNALKSTKDNIYTMLKAATAKYGTPAKDAYKGEDDWISTTEGFTWNIEEKQ